MKTLEIWQPRYKDQMVLIAKYKVKPEEEYKIVFTKAKHLEGQDFFMNGDIIMQYPLESNGKIDCYAVPMAVIKDNQ